MLHTNYKTVREAKQEELCSKPHSLGLKRH